MAKYFTPPISEEKFAAFIEGNLSETEMYQIQNLIERNEDMQNIISQNIDIDTTLSHYIKTEIEAPYNYFQIEIPDINTSCLIYENINTPWMSEVSMCSMYEDNIDFHTSTFETISETFTHDESMGNDILDEPDTNFFNE